MAPPKRKGGRTLPATSTDTTSSRVTAKGSGAVKKAPISDDDHAHRSSEGSSRYTPPGERAAKMDMPSPPWVPVLMFSLLALGGLVIIANYVGILPGSVDNAYLAVGLVLILGGIVTATQYR